MLPAYLAIVNDVNDEQIMRRRDYREIHLQHVALRHESDPFALPETRFVNLFRLNKYMVQFLITTLGPHMKRRAIVTEIPPELRIFCTLIFYGTGTYQRVTGQSYLACMSQTSVSRAIREVTELINDLLVKEFIKFPQSQHRKQTISDEFERVAGFPGIIGAIDCTFVTMIKPRVEEHNYINRHQQHSKNVQLVI